jgi:hypothetical protein
MYSKGMEAVEEARTLGHGSYGGGQRGDDGEGQGGVDAVSHEPATKAAEMEEDDMDGVENSDNNEVNVPATSIVWGDRLTTGATTTR